MCAYVYIRAKGETRVLQRTPLIRFVRRACVRVVCACVCRRIFGGWFGLFWYAVIDLLCFVRCGIAFEFEVGNKVYNYVNVDAVVLQ